MLKWVYANTTDYNHRNEQCPLRNLLIDQCAWLLDESWLLRTGEAGVQNDTVFPREALIECEFFLFTLLSSRLFEYYLL